jgi:transcriptional regulator with XRE-family HTH domain
MEGFGARVALARGKVGWTRRELATRAGLHEQHLAKVEREQRPRLEADTVVKLAKALGCTSDYLLGLAEDPTPRRRTIATPLPPRQSRARTRRQSAVPTQPRTPAPVG